jgi:hypothetical protein
MKTFWTNILTPAPSPFSRYSLYTPAKHEHNVCKLNRCNKYNEQKMLGTVGPNMGEGSGQLYNIT